MAAREGGALFLVRRGAGGSPARPRRAGGDESRPGRVAGLRAPEAEAGADGIVPTCLVLSHVWVSVTFTDAPKGMEFGDHFNAKQTGVSRVSWQLRAFLITHVCERVCVGTRTIHSLAAC